MLAPLKSCGEAPGQLWPETWVADEDGWRPTYLSTSRSYLSLQIESAGCAQQYSVVGGHLK